MLEKIRQHCVSLICICILCVYLIAILMGNFSGNPAFYSTDMYSDMIYAEEVWTQKSIFPEGWVFGNQLYAVATPVVASLFYGLTGNHCVAMAIASTLMGMGVLFSFNWMQKPLFPSARERLIGVTVFVSLVLASGDMVFTTNGWQLLFTMCSYYACYAIAVFLAFGCYLRKDSDWSFPFVGMLLLSCLLSFGTGIQSLRQTAIMVCPLIAVEALSMLFRAAHKEKILNKATLIAGLIAVSNILGLLYSKLVPVDQVEIFGNLELADISDIFTKFRSALFNLLTLLLPAGGRVAALLVLICALVFLLFRLHACKKQKQIICLCLLVFGVAVILVIETFTTMYVRNIYYFLLFPLIAFTVGSLYACIGKIMHYVTVAALLLMFAFNCTARIAPFVSNSEPNTAYEEVANYLENNRISTVYSCWDCAEKIVIASDFRLKAGFWDSSLVPFDGVDYLCNPKVFDAEAADCAYVFLSEAAALTAAEAAAQRNADFTLAKHFPESDIYVYTSTVNLMQ